MSLICDTLDDEEQERIRLALLENEVVTGPPLLMRVVEELWPDLVHKVKPPRELMH
jgi:hypothetical protein